MTKLIVRGADTENLSSGIRGVKMLGVSTVRKALFMKIER